MNPSSAQKLWYLAFPALVSLLLGLPSVLYPFGFDQSNHAFIAWRCLQGEVLFTDVFSLKPPLTILLHALSQLFFGHHMWSIRLLDIIWIMLEAILVAQLIRQVFPRQPAWVPIAGAFFYTQLYYTLSFWHTSQTDAWASLPVTLGLVAATRHWHTGNRDAKALPLLAGICLAAAIGFKYTFAAAVAAPILAAFLGPASSWRSRLSRSALVIGGLAIGMATMAAILMAWGAWDGFVHNHLAAVVGYGGAVGNASGSEKLALPLRVIAHLGDVEPAIKALEMSPTAWVMSFVALAISPIILWRARHDERFAPGLLIIILWWCGAWTSTAAQGRFFAYHFSPMLAPLGVLTAVGLHEVLSVLIRRPLQRWQWTILLATLCLCFSAASTNGQRPNYTSPGHQYALLLTHAREDFDLVEHWSSPNYRMTPSFLIEENLTVAHLLKQHAKPGDRLFTWGTSTALYYLTELPPATSVFTSVQVTEDLDQRIDRAQWLDEFRADLPRFFVVQKYDAIPHVLPNFLGSDRELLHFPELYMLLKQRYALLGFSNTMEVLELRTPQNRHP